MFNLLQNTNNCYYLQEFKNGELKKSIPLFFERKNKKRFEYLKTILEKISFLNDFETIKKILMNFEK